MGVGRQRQALLVSLVVGLAVAVTTSVVAFAFLLGATWSGIHGGYGGYVRSQITLAIFSLGATAAPPALGFLAGWGTYRVLSKTGRRD